MRAYLPDIHVTSIGQNVVTSDAHQLCKATIPRSSQHADCAPKCVPDSGVGYSLKSDKGTSELQQEFELIRIDDCRDAVKIGREKVRVKDTTKQKTTPSCLSEDNLHRATVGFVSSLLTWLNGLREQNVVLTVRQMEQAVSQYSPTRHQIREANEWFWDTRDEDGYFKALEAAADGDDNVVNLAILLADDVSKLSMCDSEKRTVLHFAVIKCKAETVRNIVTKGGDHYLADIYGDTPMHLAAQIGRHDVILEMCRPLTREETRHSYFHVPYRCLPVSGLGNKMNHQGWTPAHVAAEYGHRDCLAALVKHALSDVDCRRLGDGYTAAHIAVELKNVEMLTSCLDLGSDSEVRNYRGETPQQMAFLMGRQDIIVLCQRYGASARQQEFAETEQIDWLMMLDDYVDCKYHTEQWLIAPTCSQSLTESTKWFNNDCTRTCSI